jgi:hypothetical protein
MSNTNVDNKNKQSQKCVHGYICYCISCEAEVERKVGRICKHGNPWFCSYCGKVSDIKKEAK